MPAALSPDCGALGCDVDGDPRIHQRNALSLSQKALAEAARADDAGFDGAIGLRIVGMIVHGIFLSSDERVAIGYL